MLMALNRPKRLSELPCKAYSKLRPVFMNPAWNGEAFLYNPNEVVAEWQRLMGRWELAYADYTTLCAKEPMSDGDKGALVCDIGRAQVNLVGVKREIDALLARSAARAQAKIPDGLQFTIIDCNMTDLVEPQSGTKI
jgi:hypothetical protein